LRREGSSLGSAEVLNYAIYVRPAVLARFVDTPRDEIEKRLFGSVTAQLLFTQPLLRHMAERGTGTIAFTASGSGYAPPTAPPGEGGRALAYGVSKAALHRIAEQLVVEHPDLRFYNLQLGAVATERVLASGSALERLRSGYP
jgi:NAD(P)-dependent dehydrogenase (short-subunit alcohol dehydrogenase family)